jgi:hypothetical protein
MFAGLVRDLRVVTSRDAHLDTLMNEFENTIRDLRADSSDGRIKTSYGQETETAENTVSYPRRSGTFLGR